MRLATKWNAAKLMRSFCVSFVTAMAIFLFLHRHQSLTWTAALIAALAALPVAIGVAIGLASERASA
jgi:hypothetical protein